MPISHSRLLSRLRNRFRQQSEWPFFLKQRISSFQVARSQAMLTVPRARKVLTLLFYRVRFSASTIFTLGREFLAKRVAHGALHNAAERYDPPKCHPRTRETILRKIMDWIYSPEGQARHLWIYGPAGSGKSAIAQTIVELHFK